MVPPPKTDQDVPGVVLVEQVDHPFEQDVVGATEQAQADGVDILLDGRRDDLLGTAADAGVDHLITGLAEQARHVLGTAVVPVKARFADQDAALGFDTHPVNSRSPARP